VTTMIKSMTALVKNDRKGVTALEYALIAAAAAAVILGAYQGLFSRLNTFLGGITFSAGS
jgi:Flp pilus assembly pilin Flp